MPNSRNNNICYCKNHEDAFIRKFSTSHLYIISMKKGGSLNNLPKKHPNKTMGVQ